jgi:hypothetical protein
MSIQDMRIGDTIFSVDGTVYKVVKKFGDKVKARAVDPPKLLKTFRDEKLFCVDFDDGLWQEIVNS